jgi:lipopolysaccharide export system permease protein
MKILYRYLTEEISAYFIVSLAIFFFVFTMEKGFFLSSLLLKKGVSLPSVLYLLLLWSPAILGFVIPMAFLCSVIIAWARFTSCQEIVAIEASGISIKRFFLITCLLSALLSVFTCFINHKIAPASAFTSHSLCKKLADSPSLLIEERTFTKLNGDELYVEKIKEERLYDVYLTDETRRRIIFAKAGRFAKEEDSLIFYLKDGTIHQADENEPTRYHILRFKEHTFSISQTRIGKRPSKKITHLTSDELLKRKRNPASITEFHKRMAISFAPFFFTLVAVPIGLATKRREKSVGFGAACFIILLYYIILVGAEAVSKRGVGEGLLMWTPNAVLCGIGVFMNRKVIRR